MDLKKLPLALTLTFPPSASWSPASTSGGSRVRCKRFSHDHREGLWRIKILKSSLQQNFENLPN